MIRSGSRTIVSDTVGVHRTGVFKLVSSAKDATDLEFRPVIVLFVFLTVEVLYLVSA